MSAHPPLQNPQQKKTHKPLKVGFDLDGVLLYNPARIIRMPVKIFKRRFFPKKEKVFYIPQSKPERFLWHIFHMSSLYVPSGLSTIKQLAESRLIEPYIITARYDFLEKDFLYWLRKMDAPSIFKGAFMNENNLQPHLFKEKMVKELDLDVFVEDNWDIVRHLSEKKGNKELRTSTYWIYNIFDRQIDYPFKFPSLSKAVMHLHKKTQDEKA